MKWKNATILQNMVLWMVFIKIRRLQKKNISCIDIYENHLNTFERILLGGIDSMIEKE